MKNFEELDYYEILDIPIDASSFEISRAYRNALELYSEDSLLTYSLFSDRERVNILKKIVRAYNTLSDDTKRRTYNERLGLNQISRNNQEQMNIDTVQPLKDRKDIAYSQGSTNRNHPSILAQTFNAETGPNPLHDPVQNRETKFLKKNLRQFLYLSAGITVILVFLTFVMYGALKSWYFLKQVYSVRFEVKPDINGETSKSLIGMPVMEKEKHTLSEARENSLKKVTDKVELVDLNSKTSKVYINLASVANIRLSADINSRVITKIRRGKELNVIGKTGEWLMLELEDESIGWIHRSLVGKKALGTTVSMVGR